MHCENLETYEHELWAFNTAWLFIMRFYNYRKWYDCKLLDNRYEMNRTFWTSSTKGIISPAGKTTRWSRRALLIAPDCDMEGELLAFALMAHGEVELAASGIVAVLFRHSWCSSVVVSGAPQLAQHCAAVDKREAATDVGSRCGMQTSISLCCDKTSFSHGELLQVYCGVYGLLKSNRTMRRQSFNIRNQHKALHKETERERDTERQRERRKERTDTT